MRLVIVNPVALWGAENIAQSDASKTCFDSTGTVNQLDIQQWYVRVYARCQALLLSATDAEDAAQETFVRALVGLSELQTQPAIHGWLRSIARNVCVDMIRRKQVRRAENVEHVELPAQYRQADNEEHEHMMHHIYGLPEPLREIILLHYYEEMTYDEMAQWLGVARSTVNERLAKARQLLKQELCAEKSS